MVTMKRILATCGNGAFGRLGHGIECRSQTFLRIVGSLVGYNIKSVACGGAHTAVLTDDGTLFTFGQNDLGQLGHSKEDKFVAVPIEVGLPDPVQAVAAGEHHTLCVTTAGEVWAWGSHNSGQLGIGDSDQYKHVEPRLVKELTGKGVVGLAAGVEHSLALADNGHELYSWGYSNCGALGLGRAIPQHGTTSPRRVRTAPLGPTQARGAEVVAGPYTSGLRTVCGRVWTWGHAGTWALGHNEQLHEFIPKQVQALSDYNISSLSLAQSHSMATTRDGRSTFVWGSDNHGSLGYGDGNWQQLPYRVPRELKTLPPELRAQSVCAGWQHSMLVTKEEGRLWTWGWSGAALNDDSWVDGGGGQLGHGDDSDRWGPTPVNRLYTSPHRFYDLRMSYIKPWKVVQVAAGRTHTAAVVDVELDMRDVA